MLNDLPNVVVDSLDVPARGNEAEEGQGSQRLDSGYRPRAASHLHYRLAKRGPFQFEVANAEGRINRYAGNRNKGPFGVPMWW
jgi:hypothetical protein